MFVPKESDKVWMRNLILMLKDDGIWGTDWATYKKIDDNTLQVIHRNPSLSSGVVKMNINRVQIVMESIGGKLLYEK